MQKECDAFLGSYKPSYAFAKPRVECKSWIGSVSTEAALFSFTNLNINGSIPAAFHKKLGDDHVRNFVTVFKAHANDIKKNDLGVECKIYCG